MVILKIVFFVGMNYNLLNLVKLNGNFGSNIQRSPRGPGSGFLYGYFVY